MDEEHVYNLKLITESTGILPEGGCLYRHNTFEVSQEALSRRKNLVALSKNANNIIEIGFNMGHSCLLFLLSNPNCKVACFDTCDHKYTEHCFNYLDKKFPDRIKLYKGDSNEMLGSYTGPLADLCHIDGSHESQKANVDFFLCRNKAKNDGIIIFSDTWMEHLKSLWEGYVRDKLVTEIFSGSYSVGKLTRPNVKIAVATLALGEEYRKIVECGTITRVKYCEKYGYDFREDEDVHDKTRPPAWSKILLLLKCLNEGKENKYDYVVWIDADTLIMNPEKKLEDFIGALMGDSDLMVAKDWTRINSGVIFVKNTEWSKKFLEEVYSKEEFIHDPDWDQKSLQYCYDNNILDSREHVHVLPLYQQSEFNSYYFMYKYGHFLVHCAGCFRLGKNTGRLDELLERLFPFRMDRDTDESYNRRMNFIRNINQ